MLRGRFGIKLPGKETKGADKGFGHLNSAIPAFALKGVNIPRMYFKNGEQLLGHRPNISVPKILKYCQCWGTLLGIGLKEVDIC